MPSEHDFDDRSSRRLHPASLLFSIGSAAGRLLLPGILLLVASRGSNYELWLMPLFAFAVIGALAKFLSYRYRFGSEELVVREGIVTRNERHIPYARIQNVDLVQNPLHRLLGVAEVRLETAGGQKPEAVMRVLSLDAITQMRARVFAGRREVVPSAEAATPASTTAAAASPARLLLHLTPRDVFLFGVISNRGMVVVAAVLGASWQFDLWERWQSLVSKELLEDFPRFRPQDNPLAALLLGLGLVIALVVLLRVLSITWAFVKLYGFRLRRRGDDLRAEYGLLTRVSKTLPRRRIQLISTRQTMLHRWFGRAAVQVQTAGGAGSEGQDGSGGDRTWLAPLIRTEQIAPLLREVLPEAELAEAEWQPVSAGAGRRLLRRGLVWVGLVGAAGGLGLGPWGLLPALLLSPLVWVHARLYVRHAAYAVTPRAVFYRSGWWVRRMSVTRFSKIQALALTESPFDRRNRMATLRVDTAGGGRIGHGVAVAFLDVPVASRLLDRLSHEAGSRAFRW